MFICSGCVRKYDRRGGLTTETYLFPVTEAASPTAWGQHGPVLVRTLFRVADSCLLLVSSRGGKGRAVSGLLL